MSYHDYILQMCDHEGEIKYPLTDARGIFCTYVCPRCEEAKMKEYRPEIFEDPNYWADEDIEPDEY